MRPTRAIIRVALAVGLAVGAAGAVAGADPPPPGPPFPAPETNRAVYDFAGVFRADSVARVEATIDEIEARTGAEVVVYSQVAGYGITIDQAEGHARALIDQWGIGRRGFDDSLVILFDLDPTRKHGQVQLYAGAGYKAAFLSDDERQNLYEGEMLPYLQAANLDGALLIAIERIDENASAEHAATLTRARQLDAVLGLLVAPLLLLLAVGWAVFQWLRYGKDPIYLDDPSIHMPAPPDQLTAAAGAAIMDGQSSRRALTTAMLDLASRGLLSFREQRGLLGLGATRVGIDLDPPRGDQVVEAHRALNARRPISPAEELALTKLRSLAPSGYLEADDVPKFGASAATFDERLESQLVKNRWMGERPGKVTNRWRLRGALAIAGGVAIAFAAANLPSAGLVAVGVAAIIAGVVLLVLAGAMPAVTMSGAMIRAMLHAYRRTLHKTMAMARSMQQVVDEARLPWLETPDQAVVWGTALGLQGEVEKVLDRSLEDLREGSVTGPVYLPVWYTNSDGQGFSSAAAGGGGGLFSSSAIPNIGGMMSALGTIGNSPASSGSGGSGGGGFGGGGSSGGGGSGGGF